MVPVSRLPDLCLIALFKAMPLGDRLSARKVCRKWSNLIVGASLRRRSLTLLIGSRTRKEFSSVVDEDYITTRVLQHVVKEDGTALVPLAAFTEWNSVLLDTLTLQDVEKIAETFRNTSQLLVVIGETKPTDWQSLASLLDTWSNQLVTFRFYIGSNRTVDIGSTSVWFQFFAALNALPALKNLALNMRAAVCPFMPILARLEQFALSSLQPQPYFLFSLLLFVDQSASAPLRQVAFTADGLPPNYDDPQAPAFLKLDASLRARFTRFNSLSTLPSSRLQDICANFVSLTFLSIEAPSSLRVLFDNLAQLPRLLFLQLCVDFDKVNAEDPPVVQLVSVKALQIDILMHSHEQLSLLPVGSTMPNVQVISAEFTGSCVTCKVETYDFGYDFFGFDFDYEEAENGTEAEGDLDGHLKEEGGNEEENASAEANPDSDSKSDSEHVCDFGKTCFRPVFAQWKRECTSLRKIMHNFEFVLGSAEELLREE